MKIITNAQILGIVEQIKETERMMDRLKKHPSDPAILFTIEQFEDLKRDFVKQLLTELLQSHHNIADIEPFLQQAIMYLKKFDRKDTKTGVLKKNLKEVERMIASL
jgi:hypothetical protein